MTRCKFAPARHDGDPDSEADHSGARVTCRVASLKATVGRHRRERAKVKLVGEEDSDAPDLAVIQRDQAIYEAGETLQSNMKCLNKSV